jgi:AAA+ ATPase superfamily predicted ATPase
LDASILARELPFGESARTTKKTLYRIDDPTLRFWFRVFSPHQSRWSSYTPAEKRKLIHDHASTVFEDYCRSKFPGAARHWEGDLELDLVAPDPADASRVVVAELKWKRLSAAARKALLAELEAKWVRSTLAARYRKVRFEVLDASLVGA